MSSSAKPHTEAPEIEVLYVAGCANLQRTITRVRALLERDTSRPSISLREIRTFDEAHARRLPGSPTVCVGGIDVEPGARSRRDYGIKCRLYRTADGLTGILPEASILAALTARAA